jgi:hypothetical protein
MRSKQEIESFFDHEIELFGSIEQLFDETIGQPNIQELVNHRASSKNSKNIMRQDTVV